MLTQEEQSATPTIQVVQPLFEAPETTQLSISAILSSSLMNSYAALMDCMAAFAIGSLGSQS